MAGVAMAAILVVAGCSSGSSPTSTPEPGGLANVAGLSGNLSAFDAARLAQILPPGSSQQLGIWVDGAGSVTATPDVALLNFGVEARADNVAPARAAAAAAMEAVLSSLRANGVDEADIKTTSFQIQPIIIFREITRDGTRRSEPEIVGYRVTNLATAKIRDIDGVGRAIDDAAAAGGDLVRINSIGFTVDDPQPLEDQARELAIRNAMAKAQQMASVANVILGQPVFISQQGGAPVISRQAFAAAIDEFAPTPILAGEQEITVRVQMVFAIVS